MKKVLSIICIAVMAFAAFSCKKDNENKPDVNKITEDGFYVVGDATGQAEVTALLSMAKGINEANNQTPRDGMFEKYIVLEGGKEFTLAYVNGGKQEAYGAELSEFKPADLSGVYDSNPADKVFKGKLVIGDSAPKMKVSATGLYHIVLDLNTANDLKEAQILLCPVTMGVRGGMNSWGFTPLEATAASNAGITFTLSGQKLADGGEFKFAYNSAWKITLDEEGAVKANTNLGKDCKPGGDNIAVTEGAGTYKITLTYKLAAGDIANSFKYEIAQESKSEMPTTMYMIGTQFGGWDWASDGIVDLVPVYGKQGAFWCTRYFTTDGFKFCALREWNGDFTGLGADEGYTVTDGNCFVPAAGFYTVYINLEDKVLEIKPAEVYGIGDAWGANAWDFNAEDPVKFEAEGETLVAVVTNNSEAVRLSSKVMPTVKVDGCVDAGWFDWWKTEFVYFDGKIAYRGAGNDQERVAVEAGKKIIIDFNAGTVAVEDNVPFVGAITIDGDMSDWADIAGEETPDNICKEMKVTNDEKYFYVYLKSEPGSRGSKLWGEEAGYYYVDFDWDNNPETGIAENKNPGFDCWFYMYVFGGTAEAPEIKLHPNGSGKEMSIENITAKGVITDELIEIEISIPRADMVPVAAGTETRILSWRSKDGTVIEMTYTVK